MRRSDMAPTLVCGELQPADVDTLYNQEWESR